MAGGFGLMTAGRIARTIFWAEDDAADQFMIREAARQATPAANITFFEDGQALVDAVARSRPEQVVLDIRMPRMSGVQALEALRQDPRNRDLPIVMFSTALIEGELELCVRLGVRAFVQKPSDFAAFEVAVGAILDGTATGVQPAMQGRTALAQAAAGTKKR